MKGSVSVPALMKGSVSVPALMKGSVSVPVLMKGSVSVPVPLFLYLHLTFYDNSRSAVVLGSVYSGRFPEKKEKNYMNEDGLSK